MIADAGEVITVSLASIERDAAHVQMALRYGATQQAKVRLVVGELCSLSKLDDLIEAQLEHLGHTLGLLPPLIEIQCRQRLPGGLNK